MTEFLVADVPPPNVKKVGLNVGEPKFVTIQISPPDLKYALLAQGVPGISCYTVCI